MSQFGYISHYCMHSRNLSLQDFQPNSIIAREHNSKHVSDSLKHNSTYVLQQATEVSLGQTLPVRNQSNVLGSRHSCYMKWKLFHSALSGPIKCTLLQMHKVYKFTLLFLLSCTNSSKQSVPTPTKFPRSKLLNASIQVLHLIFFSSTDTCIKMCKETQNFNPTL